MSKEFQKAIIEDDSARAISLLIENDDIKKNINRPHYHSKYNLKVTSLYLASDHGIVDVVKILLDIPGINVNYEAERGADTPLHAAASGGYKKIVELLLNEKCHCVSNMFGSTPLQRAAANGQDEVLVLLLMYDKSLMNEETLNKTPLHWACKHGHLPCVEVLVKHGADITQRNSNNKRPVDTAREKRHMHIVQFLQQGQDTEEEVSEYPQEEKTTKPEGFDDHDGHSNLRSFADLGAHQAYFEEEQVKVNIEYAHRIHELEEHREEQKSANAMFADDIEDVKADCLDLRSMVEEQDHQRCEAQQQQGAFNTDVKGWIQTLETSHNAHREDTTHDLKALAQRVQGLETKLKQYREPQKNATNENAKHLCSIARRNFLVLKENMLASDHLDYLYSKEALTLGDTQMILSKPGDLAQTTEMLYRLLGKKDPSWIYIFLKSLDRDPGTRSLIEIFRK